jgi:hypothetical protein
MIIGIIVGLTAVLAFLLLVLVVWLLLRKTLGLLHDREYRSAREKFLRAFPELLFLELPEQGEEAAKIAWTRAITRRLGPLHRALQSGTRVQRRIRRAAARDVLEEISETVAGEARHRITYLFEQFGFVREEVHLLSNRRWWTRGEAARRLGITRSPKAVLPLMTVLRDKEREVRLAASQSLIDIAGVRGALHQILQNLHEITPWMAVLLSKRILTAGQASVGPLLAGLHSASPSVRRFCIRMLGELRAPEAIGPILARFQTMDRETRCVALVTLGRCGDERVLDLLLANLSPGDEACGAAAVSAIAFLGARSAVPHLKILLEMGSVALKRVAAEALSKLPPQGVLTLQEIGEKGEGPARLLALQTLDELSMVEEA